MDPFIGMAYALARTTNLKVGTSVAVLPGRHPVLVAKQLASLAGLAPNAYCRCSACGLRFRRNASLRGARRERAAVFDESLRLLRSVLEQHDVSFAGDYFSVSSAAVEPRPVKPLDIWLGGSAPAGFRRIGRLGDGWLGSFLIPGRSPRRSRADPAGGAGGRPRDRTRPFRDQPRGQRRRIAGRIGFRGTGPPAHVDPTDLISGDWPHLHRQLDGGIEAGLTKFVIRPAVQARIEDFIDRFVAELVPRQN